MTAKQAQDRTALILAILGAILIAIGQWKKPPEPPVDPDEPIVVPDEQRLPLRVLIVWDHTKEVPTEQDRIINSIEFRKWIQSDGGSYRFVPDNADFSSADARWQEIWKSRPNVLPAMVISNGGAGAKGPLPATVDEAKALVEKYR